MCGRRGATSADCPNPSSFCAPRGVFGNKVRYCAALSCHTDADCTAKPNGMCAPVLDPCCGAARGLFCVYQDGCRDNSQCNPDQHCEVNVDGEGVCVDGFATCPG
ncbi:MAG: hypothetical protein U0165_21015 [Polyangiaceae bacterium]